MAAHYIVMGAAGASSGPVNYVDDVFSTWLYNGGGNKTITNGIDLATKGGLVWIKSRTIGNDHAFCDTARGNTKYLRSNTTGAESTLTDQLTSFNTNGFSLNDSGSTYLVNAPSRTYASWTFRKAPKFFDVVTGTGGTSNISHNLGSVPAMVILKQTATTDDWYVFHRSSNGYFKLNTTDARQGSSSIPGIAASGSYLDATATTFNVQNFVNTGNPYVAYLFAHNAGGFGATGTDNVISCGSYTGNGSATGPVINLGYEPQYVLIKNASLSTTNWSVFDVMRGWSMTSQNLLRPNSSGAEIAGLTWIQPTATGFQLTDVDNDVNASGSTYIYMAIRRPMKPPTSGTEVFSPVATTDAVNTFKTTGFPIDLQMQGYRPGISANIQTIDRLRGTGTIASSTSSVPRLASSSTAAETSATAANGWNNTGFQISSGWDGNNMVYWNFRRAPGFFDVVCYTGTGSARTVAHNLGVAPELMIFKNRVSTTINWNVNVQSINTNNWTLSLNTDEAVSNKALFSTAPTSSLMTFTGAQVNVSGNGYVAYLFASVAGVSKVGSYTGNGGSSQDINCGFSSGARFVMVKAASGTGDWWVWDTARGITSGNDASIRLNTTDAEVTSLNFINPLASGFTVVGSDSSRNGAGIQYIFLAIA